jgi:hypothetical protein
MAFNLKKLYQNTKGLDLRSSDLTRDAGAATSITNMVYRQTGAMSKRKGYKHKTDIADGGLGLRKYNNINISTGVITEQLVNVDDDLHLYTTQTFNVTYSGSTNAYYDLYLDASTSTFKFDLYNDNTIDLTVDLGTGLGASDKTIAQLETLIDAETDFTCTIGDAGSTPAAFLPVARNVDVATNPGTTVNYYTWEVVDAPGTYTTPFSNHFAARDDADFENASFAEFNDALYIANGYDGLHKYDGNRVYLAGLAIGTTPTTGATGTGSLTYSAGEDYLWKYTYEHTDAKENIVESYHTATVGYTTTGANESKAVVVTNLTAGSGYSIDQGTVDGAQATVTTITMVTGNDLKVNDQVYITDSITSSVVKRKITASSDTSITIDGSAVTVADTDIISQVKISLWRTKADGTLYYLSKELVNDTGNATTSYDDGTADASLGVERVEPLKVGVTPPNMRYIDVWRGQIVMTGDRTDVNNVAYSDFSGENFPADQSFLTSSRLGGGNTGVKAQDNKLFVFKPESISAVTGDFGVDTFEVDTYSDEGIGCVAHATIQEMDSRIWFLGKQGVYSCDGVSKPVEESIPVKPRFDQTSTYREKRAVSFYWIAKEMYLLLLPEVSTDGSSNDYLDAASSKVMVFDRFRRAWLEWDNFNMLGGMAELNDDIIMSGIDQNPPTLLASTFTQHILENGTLDDYADHAIATDFEYKSHWESMGEPSVFKKFLRMKVLSLDGSINDFETDVFTLALTTEHNYRPVSVASISFDFSGGSSGWGNSGWGEFVWGEARLNQLKSKLSANKALSFRSIFSNTTIHENVLISGYELEVAAPYDMQLKE